MPTKECIQCGKVFGASTRKHNAKTCSPRCRSDWVRVYYPGWAAANRDKMRAYRTNWKRQNRAQLKATHVLRYRTDPQYKLAVALRNRLNRAIRNDWKVGSAVSDLGCPISGFKAYIETKFLPGMSWGNWGVGEGNWHLDHIIPLSAWNLQDRTQFLRALHYTNYQPLWSTDNTSKGAKWV